MLWLVRDDGSQGRTAMSVEANKALVRRYIAELNRGNLAILDEVLAPDYRLNGEAVGREGGRQYSTAMRAAFPGLQSTIEDLVAEGDAVVMRYTRQGTNTGELRGMPPTGRTVTAQGFNLCRIRDGQIHEEWDLDDRLSAMQQLGLLPGPASA